MANAPHRRILLIDDDRDSRELYRRLLEWSGFEVEIAPNGMAGLRAARDRRPDVILLDLMMPGMDGGSVLRQLRTDELTQAIPVLALTGVPEWLEDHGESPAFDGVVLKPAIGDDLLRQIARVLDDPQTRP